MHLSVSKLASCLPFEQRKSAIRGIDPALCSNAQLSLRCFIPVLKQ